MIQAVWSVIFIQIQPYSVLHGICVCGGGEGGGEGYSILYLKKATSRT